MTLYQVLSIIGVPSLITSVIVYSMGSIRHKIYKEKAIRDGVLAILHNMLYKQGIEHIQNGEITFGDMKDYEYLYNAYHELGGNGTGTEIFNRVKNLKSKKGEHEEQDEN